MPEEEKKPLSPAQTTATQLIQVVTPDAPSDGYYLLTQSPSSNKLTKKVTQKITDPAQFDLFGDGHIDESDFRLFIKGYRELAHGVKQSAAMLLDSLMIIATENGMADTLVTLPLKRYMQMRGLSDEKEIRKQVKADIDALERISFEYRGTGKNKGAWLRVHIAGGTSGQIKNGDIIFRFNQDFFDSFKVGDSGKYLYMFFPPEALQGSIRANPWKYWLARKIAEHKRMNIGKPNEDVIGVQTLIDGCPDYPKYEDVMAESRHVGMLIIDPFERNMDALAPRITWEYQLPEPPRDYHDFIDANVAIHWSAYPKDRMIQIEAGKKKRAKRQQAGENPAPRKKQKSANIPLPGMEDIFP